MTTSNNHDYYAVLGLNSSAGPQEIREAYRKLAFQYHPDRNKDDPQSTEKMKAINEAYATLSDPVKKADYDSLRQRFGPAAYDRFRQTHSQEDIFRNSDIDQIINEFSRSFGFRNADQMFSQFYGSNFRIFFYNQPGFTSRSYDDAPSNNHVNRTLTNAKPGLADRMVKYLFKKVLRYEFPERGKDIKDMIHINPEMAQRGGEIEYNYQKWGKPKNLMVKIPAGIQDSQKIRLREMGMAGKAGGGPGDLLITVKVNLSLATRLKNILKR
jgi:DnaJ-class molecular chaperone